MRLMHHSMNHSEPPANYRCSAASGGDDAEYLAPGGHTLVALFTVTKTARREHHEVYNTEDAMTWQFITALRAVQDAKLLQVVQKTAKFGSDRPVGPAPQEQSETPPDKQAGTRFHLPDMLVQLLAGAPTLAIVLADRRELAAAEVRPAGARCGSARKPPPV